MSMYKGWIMTRLEHLTMHQESCTNSKVLCAESVGKMERCVEWAVFIVQKAFQSDIENKRCLATSHSSIHFSDSHLQ